jgi:prephenate dehydrogenase
MFKKLGLIGCGLMGGSFALALRQANLVSRIVGYGHHESTLIIAKELGAIDEISLNLEQTVKGADLILIAIPVNSIAKCLEEIKDSIEPNALLMDVGSTKLDITSKAIDFLGSKLSQFVPTHPIAGKEASGIQHASADLFVNRPLIITPLPQTSHELIEHAKEIWSAIGSKVHLMSANDHDKAFAAVSHLPHLIAFAFMNGLTEQQDHDKFLSIAGPGFRDFSRIAAGDPKVWSDIFLANKENLIEQLSLFKSSLQFLEQSIERSDSQTLFESIEKSRQSRVNWSINE